MSLTLLNNVAETTTTTGTGSYLLAGVVSSGYRPFGDGGNGAIVPYKVENADKTKSEWGYGTYNSGANTLARTTIVGNYLGTTAAIDWAAGTKNIYSPPLKELLTWATYNNSGDVSALKVAESSAPSTPASGFVSVYAKTDGKLYIKDDTGTETDLTAGSTLDSLGDVVITSAASGDLVRHNGTNWVNASLATAGIQPLDATLTAFAALTIAANSLTIGSGADAFSQTTFAASTFPARASTGNLVAKTITDFALTILDDADAAAVRATIGAGTGSGDALVANPLSQFAATTSAQLAGVLSDETGDGGGFVRANNATLVTPTLGVATATSINKLTLTAPATAATLTIADGATLTVSASATISNGTHSGTNTGDQTNVSGNAGTTTALATARNINGVAFDGTANITITAAPADGDKGDITVSGSGATFTIDNGVVTAAKTSITGTPTGSKFLRDDWSWQTIAGGGDALVANPLSQFAATTSAQLAGVISDEVGTDKLVFNTSPGFATAANPISNDGAALGTTALGWSDLHLATGALINVANGDAVITHSGGIFTVSTGDLRVTTAGANTASCVTVGGTQTLTNKTLTAPTIAASTMSGSHQVTGRIYTNLDTLTDGATITLDFSLGNKFTVTLGGNRIIEFSNDVAGQVIAIRLLQDGTGSRTITWPAGIKWAGGSAPTLTTTASKADWIMIVPTTAGSSYDGAVLSQNH